MDKNDIKVEHASSNAQFEECLQITKSAWVKLSEIDQIPTHVMKASARTGQFLVGLLDNHVIGYSMSFIQLPSTLYLHAIGVRDDMQSMGVGEAIMKKMKGEAISSGFKFIDLTYEPLVGKNANLYVHKMGGTIDTYENDAYCKTQNKSTGGEASADRFLVSIDLNDSGGHKPKIGSLEEVLPIRLNEVNYNENGEAQITEINQKAQTQYNAIEIPSYRDSVTKTSIVLQYRDIFQKSLKHQRIVDFLSFGEKEERKNFYILRNR